MEAQKLISDLKHRSGRTLKFMIKEIIRFDLPVENQTFYLVLMTNQDSKICVIMQKQHIDSCKIALGKCFLVKNLKHVDQKFEFQVFCFDKSVYRESGIAPKDPLNFSTEEVNNLKTLDMKDYQMNFIGNDVPADNNIVPINQNILTLNEFLSLRSKDLRDNQIVEVINMSFCF